MRDPVLAAWGVGVDSTAMLIALVSSGQPPDHVLTAETEAEHPETYAYRAMFMRWLQDRGVPVDIVLYKPAKTRHWPFYQTLEENCLTSATLPSVSFGRKGCSAKWKIEPQDQWTRR